MNSKTSITPSIVMEYLYCPRFIYYMLYLKISQKEENRYKVQIGRNIHKKKTRINKEYLRKKIGVKEKLLDKKIFSEKHKIHGIVDEILFLDDGSAAPLDYKFAKYKNRIYKTHKYQAAMYGLMIEDKYNVNVDKAFIVFIRSKNKLIEINLNDKVYNRVKEVRDDIISIIQKGIYPDSTNYKSRCQDCTYRNICIK